MISLPEKFLATVPLSDDEKIKFVSSLNQIPPVSVRINPKKISTDFSLEKVNWCNNGYYLPERPVFTFDPVFHAGGYYVQEASSMIIGEIVKEICSKHSIKIALDLCASPGGKTTHLLSSLSDDSFLISNEVVNARLGALRENISKWGYANVCITNSDPSHFTSLENLFDLILVDAPCSGEGMFRKEEAALTEWSLKNVEMCSARQKKILEDVLPSLKPGGFLIYSTCTYNEKENEENIRFLKDNYDLEEYLADFDGMITRNSKLETRNNFHRFFPHRNKGEGLFVSVLQKKESDFSPFRLKKGNAKRIKNDFQKLLIESDKFTFFEQNERISFIPEPHFELIENLKTNLRLYKIGTDLGEQIRNEINPEHDLFLSNHFNREALPSFEIPYEDAIRFLSGESVSNIPENKGWAYFTYQKLPLGAFKSVPGRMNNYFPKTLRIRKKYENSMKFSLLSL